ncbi:MAG TPA: hypothetical protein VFG30_45030, partial [Polyangiales bacterium]|nr:hypothetical protein [Polyangiales bacterium]
MSISIDRVTVPMEEPALQQRPDAPVSTAEKSSAETVREYGRELSARTRAILSEVKRRSHGPRTKIQRNYRMAYCATVTMHDAEGNALHTIRYGRMP